MTEEQPHLRIHKWDELQHYKDREPPWIKLYNRLLDHYEFGRLSDAVKGHYLGLLMLRSRHGEPLPLDVDWLASRINATEPLDLRPLVSAGLIEVYHADSVALYQDDSTTEAFARSREAEAETEADKRDGGSLPNGRSPPSEPAVENSQGSAWNDRIAESLRDHAYPTGEPEGSWTIGQDLSIAQQLIEKGYSVEQINEAIEGVRVMAEKGHPAVRSFIEPDDQFTLRVLNRKDEQGQKLIYSAPNYLLKLDEIQNKGPASGPEPVGDIVGAGGMS